MLNSIRIFVKVVEQGSFSKAGRILSMAPSSVTRNIDHLENELGVNLFKRSTRQLILTKEGNTFLAGANKLLAQASELSESLKSISAEPERAFRISVFETFGRIHICPILPEFLERYPRVNIEIELENRMIDLNREEVDLSIRLGRPIDSSLKARKILSNHTLICASPKYIAQHGSPTIPEDLIRHNCLVLNIKRQKIYWHFSKSKVSRKIPVSGNLTSQGGTPLLDAALRGTGIIQIPNWMISNYVREDRLVVCLPDWECSVYEKNTAEIYAVYRNANYIKPSIRAFIDFLIEKTDKKVLIR